HGRHPAMAAGLPGPRSHLRTNGLAAFPGGRECRRVCPNMNFRSPLHEEPRMSPTRPPDRPDAADSDHGVEPSTESQTDIAHRVQQGISDANKRDHRKDDAPPDRRKSGEYDGNPNPEPAAEDGVSKIGRATSRERVDIRVDV